MIIKALDSVCNKKIHILNFKFLFCQAVTIEKLLILGINVDFMTAVFLHKARPCLPTVLCAYFLFKHGANKERWVNFRFGSYTFSQLRSKCNVASDRLNSYFSLMQCYFCIFIRNCKQSDHYQTGFGWQCANSKWCLCSIASCFLDDTHLRSVFRSRVTDVLHNNVQVSIEWTSFFWVFWLKEKNVYVQVFTL